MTSSTKTISQFYHRLGSILRIVLEEDKIMLLGDFNAQVGQYDAICNDALGKFGRGQSNSNGELQLFICTEHQLVITNTCFKHSAAHKNTWLHLRSKHWHLIKFNITRQRDLWDIHDTRAIRGASCSTEHIMIKAKTRLRVRRLMCKFNQRSIKLNVNKIKSDTIRNELENGINKKLSTLSGSVEDKWATFNLITVYQVSKDTYGFVERKHADWSDENDEEFNVMMAARNQARG